MYDDDIVFITRQPVSRKPQKQARRDNRGATKKEWHPGKRHEELAKKQEDDTKLLRAAKANRQILVSKQINEHPALGRWISWLHKESKQASMIRLGIIDVDGLEAAKLIRLDTLPMAVRRTAAQEYASLVDRVCTKACGDFLGDPLPVEMGGYEGDILQLQRFLRLH